MTRPPGPWQRHACAGGLVLTLALLLPATAVAKDARIEAAVRILEEKAREPFGQLERAKAIRTLGRIGGPDAAKALLPLFDDPFVHLRDHVVSAWITMLRGDHADETRTWLARQAEKHRNPTVRRGAITALGIGGGDAALALLAALAEKRYRKEKHPPVLVALARALGRRGAGLEDGLGRLLERKRGDVTLEVADAVAGREAVAEAVVERLRKMGARRSPDPLVVGALVLLDPKATDAAYAPIPLAEAMGRGAIEVDTVLPVLLRAPSTVVRAAAIRQAERRGDLAAVPHLIDRLVRETGRLRLDLVRALRHLTQTAIGEDPDLWRAWWKAYQERGGPTPVPSQPEDGDESETRSATFYRLPIRSKRIAFLLDASGSMRDPADPALPTGPTKWDVARSELARTLEALASDVRFDVFLYRYPSDFPPQPRMERALGRLGPASRANVKKAIRWLDSRKAYGWGAFSDAFDLLLREPIDTIYFLSDGRPSRGRYDRDFRLLQELERWNRYHQIVIHTVLTGRKKDDRRFLENLASSTGGMFRDGAAGTGDPR